jgi:hypothetical protein
MVVLLPPQRFSTSLFDEGRKHFRRKCLSGRKVVMLPNRLQFDHLLPVVLKTTQSASTARRRELKDKYQHRTRIFVFRTGSNVGSVLEARLVALFLSGFCIDHGSHLRQGNILFSPTLYTPNHVLTPLDHPAGYELCYTVSTRTDSVDITIPS